jgi:hypothetical protein
MSHTSGVRPRCSSAVLRLPTWVPFSGPTVVRLLDLLGSLCSRSKPLRAGGVGSFQEPGACGPPLKVQPEGPPDSRRMHPAHRIHYRGPSRLIRSESLVSWARSARQQFSSAIRSQIDRPKPGRPWSRGRLSLQHCRQSGGSSAPFLHVSGICPGYSGRQHGGQTMVPYERVRPRFGRVAGPPVEDDARVHLNWGPGPEFDRPIGPDGAKKGDSRTLPSRSRSQTMPPPRR